MPEPEEDLVPRSKYEQALARAKEAERALEFRHHAIAKGVPSELAVDMGPMDDEALDNWLKVFRDYVAEVTAQRLLEAARPDRRGGGRFLVQNGAERLPPQDLSNIEPEWLRERLQARVGR